MVKQNAMFKPREGKWGHVYRFIKNKQCNLMSARRNLNACQFSKVKLIEALSSVNEIDNCHIYIFYIFYSIQLQRTAIGKIAKLWALFDLLDLH